MNIWLSEQSYTDRDLQYIVQYMRPLALGGGACSCNPSKNYRSYPLSEKAAGGGGGGGGLLYLTYS